MTEVRRSGTRGGRRPGESHTREAILSAARVRFGEVGYDRATIRAIAADAGVDPALVHHFYGTKERLFATAMRLPALPGEVVTSALSSFRADGSVSLGEHMVAAALTFWERVGVLETFLGLLRSALASERAAAMLREFVSETILAPVAAAAADVEPAEAAYRASLVGSQMLGLALTRYVLRLGPLASADAGTLARAIGPTLDRYLTSDLGHRPAQR